MSEDIMQSFIGKVIRVDVGARKSRIGRVMDASDEHIVIFTEDAVVYYNIDYIHCFSENSKGEMEFDIEVPNDFEFIKVATFKDLLDSLKFRWVQIDCGGKKLEGILNDVKQDVVTLINKEEIFRIFMFHIENISYEGKISGSRPSNDSDSESTSYFESSSFS